MHLITCCSCAGNYNTLRLTGMSQHIPHCSDNNIKVTLSSVNLWKAHITKDQTYVFTRPRYQQIALSVYDLCNTLLASFVRTYYHIPWIMHVMLLRQINGICKQAQVYIRNSLLHLVYIKVNMILLFYVLVPTIFMLCCPKLILFH